MDNLTTDKEGVRILTEILVNKGVKRVVLSPGSRNAPLLMAFAREKRIDHYVVLDERSAAFFALGMAQQSGEAVALACTSGTALLNYAPAVAEAYYQRLPLIVISADRPAEWTDQDDSQTIRQQGALANVVKASWLLPAEIREEDERWYANRIVNDAVNCAMNGRRGPVHINVPLHEPLYGQTTFPATPIRTIEFVDTTTSLSPKTVTALAERLGAFRKVMILAGCHLPDARLKESLNRLAALEQVVVLSETPANLGDERHIGMIDRVLATIAEPEKPEYAPDLLITFGGPLISRHVKAFLRKYRPQEHWSIDRSDHPVDTFKVLTTQIALDAGVFFPALCDHVKAEPSDYAIRWQQKKELSTIRHNRFAETVPWSDWKAFSMVLPSLPAGVALQLGNSTPVRYAQLFEYLQVGRVDGNRGTSGIDGSTSTAVGAAVLNAGMTILITGDMSFLYDSNALWNKYITPRFKIIVMKNGGGGIFRFIPGPSDLAELEECFETEREVDIEGFAGLHGFQYLYADCEDELQSVLPGFYSISDRPTILEVRTPRYENAEILKEYFRKLSENIN